MGEYFRCWRRKLGLVTLALSLIFMVGWIRSLVVDDFIPFSFASESEALTPDDETVSGLGVSNQTLILYWFSKCNMECSSETAPIQMASLVVGQSTEELESSETPDTVEFASAVANVRSNPVSLFFDEPDAANRELFRDEHVCLLRSVKGLTRLSLRNTSVTDEGLKQLSDLQQLEDLMLAGKIGDAGIRNIAGLQKLTGLILDLPNLTDAGLKDLSGLKNLTILTLNNSKITDAGLKDLQELKNLAQLDLSHTAITDEGLKELSQLAQLRDLTLANSAITDAGLAAISDLGQLRSLNLNSTSVSDAGLKEISKMASLDSLHLVGTKITDNGLQELANLKTLTFLCVAKTQVTKNGAKQLKKSLPDLQIELKRTFDGALDNEDDAD